MTMETTRRVVLAGMAAAPLLAPRAWAQAPTPGITRLHRELDRILDVDTPITPIADGIQWAEGPVWVKDGGYLLFSDPPRNIMYRWKEGEGKSVFLEPSGLQGPVPAAIREPGSNGMAMDAGGRLVIADSGTRAIVRIDLKTRERTILADRFEGKRFNSCNDLVIARDGTIYFTDPPYGLTEGDTSPLKEQPVNGVYRLAPDGTVALIDGTHTRPNGIGLSPDGSWLYVSVSDAATPFIYSYPLGSNGKVYQRRIFAAFSRAVAAGLPGLPDGMKVMSRGHVFASGPGGIYVIDRSDEPLGLISTGQSAANCAFGEDGRTLFITSSDKVFRLRLKMPAW